MSNHLRMPFAEWLYRMSEANVPYQAVSLAVFAVAFKVTSNEELARLIHMDTKGVADKTYNKWKRRLSDDGFVIVRQTTVGRQTSIEVDPSYKCTPVTFTDMVRRDHRKFYGSSSVTITDAVGVESTAEPELVTDETRKSYDRKVEVTAVEKESFPHTPFKEKTPITLGNQTTTTTTSNVESDAEGGGGGLNFDCLNGTAVDLTAFIAKHNLVDQITARNMLANNVRTFGAQCMMEAFSSVVAQMPSGCIARPYPYLIETARKIRDSHSRHASEPAETRHEKVKRFAEKAEAEERLRKGRRI